MTLLIGGKRAYGTSNGSKVWLKKIDPRNTEQTKILIHSIGVPSVFSTEQQKPFQVYSTEYFRNGISMATLIQSEHASKITAEESGMGEVWVDS
jgi:hypothetical protein